MDDNNINDEEVEESNDENKLKDNNRNEEDQIQESKDDSTLEEMSDNDIIMDFESINDLCSQWNSRVTSLDLTGERVIKGLEKLTSYGINEQYASTLATAVNSLTLTIKEVINTIKNANNNQQNTDSIYIPTRVDNGNGGSNWTNGTSYNYESNSGNNSDTSSNTSVNNNNENDEITVAKLKEKATLNDYIGLSTLLSSIVTNKNSSLDDVLNNLDETEIKKKILSSVNLNDELKQMLYNADSSIIKELIKQIYKNGNIKIIDKFSMSVLEKYIEKIALKHNMSVTQLLSNNGNNKLLYNELEYFNKAMELFGNKENHATIINLYDGNIGSNVDEKLITVVRDIVDITAVQNKITAEEVIMNPSIISSIATSKDYISYLKNSTNTQNMLKELFEN